eukprot:4178979-Karenia_brevis.AAC.1
MGLERWICRWCNSMLCAPCVDLHTHQLAHRDMTYCQLWSHENNPDTCPAGLANNDTGAKFKDLNSQSHGGKAHDVRDDCPQ